MRAVAGQDRNMKQATEARKPGQTERDRVGVGVSPTFRSGKEEGRHAWVMRPKVNCKGQPMHCAHSVDAQPGMHRLPYPYHEERAN